MLYRLNTQVQRIAAEDLGAEEIYGRADLYRRPAVGRFAKGMLLCPLCERSAVRFLPFGLGGRRNALCPNCGSLERHRMLWLYLTRYTSLLKAPAKLLHTAPNPCLESILRRRPNLNYVSLDLYDPAADVQADIRSLPFEDGGFGLMLSIHVLEHLSDDRPALGELARVLRRGARAIIMVPYDAALPVTEEGGDVALPQERMARFGHPYHYRNYGADLPDRLAAAGFAVTPVWSKRLLTAHQRRRYAINDNYLFDCRRL